MVNQKDFKLFMILNDENNELAEVVGGSWNDIMDGTTDDISYTEEELIKLDTKIDNISKMLRRNLGVTAEALSTVLSRATVNRWEVYQSIKGGK